MPIGLQPSKIIPSKIGSVLRTQVKYSSLKFNTSENITSDIISLLNIYLTITSLQWRFQNNEALSIVNIRIFFYKTRRWNSNAKQVLVRAKRKTEGYLAIEMNQFSPLIFLSFFDFFFGASASASFLFLADFGFSISSFEAWKWNKNVIVLNPKERQL